MAATSPAEAEKLLREVLDALVEYGFFDPNLDQPIVRFLHPAELQVSEKYCFILCFQHIFIKNILVT